MGSWVLATLGLDKVDTTVVVDPVDIAVFGLETPVVDPVVLCPLKVDPVEVVLCTPVVDAVEVVLCTPVVDPTEVVLCAPVVDAVEVVLGMPDVDPMVVVLIGEVPLVRILKLVKNSSKSSENLCCY